MLEQAKTPLFDAVKKHIDSKVIPFHVPGHKHGKGIDEFREYVGENILQMDLNGMQELDNASNPIGVIKEAEMLYAQCFSAQNAYFLVNGTTAGVQAMIMSACQPGDEIIMPRNAHKSTIGGVILSGAIPVYIQPKINEQLGIAMGISEESVKEAIKEHPHAKAIFLINPTYYGATSDLKAIVRIAHRNNMIVLVDEAHGAHMSFHDDFPLTAMEVGADMSAVSMHKTAGSMTQSSVLLTRGSMVTPDNIKQVINLSYTTSASYVLMSSLDVARKQLALKGADMLESTLKLARYARDEINKIEGLYAFGNELIGSPGCYDIDETKLGINVRGISYTGYEIESILRKDYNIQIELSDLYNVLAVITIGDTAEDINILINALKDIASKSNGGEVKNFTKVLCNPKLIVTPRDAFYSNKKSISLEEAEGEISGEMIMAYPPGIPLICPGERITSDIIDYVKVLKQENAQLQGTADPYVNQIRVLGV